MKDFNNTRPRTVEEAIAILESCLEESDKREIIDGDLESLVIDSHFGLGLAIRNAWIYPNCIDLSSFPADRQAMFTFDPDSASQYLVEQFYKKVKEQ